MFDLKNLDYKNLAFLSFMEAHQLKREIEEEIAKLTDICFELGDELADLKGEPNSSWGN